MIIMCRLRSKFAEDSLQTGYDLLRVSLIMIRVVKTMAGIVSSRSLCT